MWCLMLFENIFKKVLQSVLQYAFFCDMMKSKKTKNGGLPMKLQDIVLQAGITKVFDRCDSDETTVNNDLLNGAKWRIETGRYIRIYVQPAGWHETCVLIGGK
jgi:hypothetical protein